MCVELFCSSRLCNKFVSDRLENDWLVELGADKVPGSRLHRLSLAVYNLALCLRLLLALLVCLDAIEEVLTTARVLHMLNADVYSLRNNSLLNAFVDNDTERVLCDVVNYSSSTMIALVWHTLLNRTITSDVDNVALFVIFHIRRKRYDALRAKLAREQVTRTTPVTLRVRHFGVLSSARV